jgi:hypothetical protein
MKKNSADSSRAAKPEMLPEYDLRGKKGERGKYRPAYGQGHTVKVRRANGTVSVKRFTVKDGAVMLAPDVRRYFPDSDSVNSALRSLIALIPEKPPTRRASVKTTRK